MCRSKNNAPNQEYFPDCLHSHVIIITFAAIFENQQIIFSQLTDNETLRSQFHRGSGAVGR